jgi:hypothetical protein
MDSRINQLIAAARLHDDLRAAGAARLAKAATASDTNAARGRFRRRRPVITTGRFVRRPKSSIPADR